MKIRRMKKARQVMSFLKNNYNFTRPYRLLLDGTFCQCALEGKINIREQLTNFLRADVILCTTRCVLDELRLLGGHFKGALMIAESFKVLKCRHKKRRADKRPKTAGECLKATVGQENCRRYILATQDANLREAIKQNVSAFASLLIHHRSIIFDHLSERCLQTANDQVESRLSVGQLQLDKRKVAQCPAESAPTIRGLRKAKGPNPLSCKKKKQPTLASSQAEQLKRKRASRRRKKSTPATN